MTNNMYGYSDYNGPGKCTEIDVENDDPLRCGHWMEGDSLAPPCGTSVSTIHKLLQFANVSSSDVLYDFGCGDGRVCLEAVVKHNAKQCVGVEVEQDLCERFQYLIDSLNDTTKRDRIHVIHTDLRDVLSALLSRAKQQSAQECNITTSANPHFQELPMPTVLAMYLLPEAMQELESDLMELLRRIPELRIVCNTWGLKSVKALKTLQVEEPDGCGSTVLYLYNNESVS